MSETDSRRARRSTGSRVPSEADIESGFATRRFEAQRDAFLADEGALAWVRMSYRDGGLLHGEGYASPVGQIAAAARLRACGRGLSAARTSRESGRRADARARSATRNITTRIRNAYNVFAELPGRDTNAGFVMAGAHLDSWVASDGAQDNAAGSAVVMEAARILSKLGVETASARFASRFGRARSRDSTARSLTPSDIWLSRAPLADRDEAKLPRYLHLEPTLADRAQAGYDALAAYFNIDNGSGKVRGIYAEGNVAVTPIFRDWLAPFASMGADAVVAAPTGGTDHVPMQQSAFRRFSSCRIRSTTAAAFITRASTATITLRIRI